MNTEILSIRNSFLQVLHGEPWYGRSVFEILDEVPPGTEYHKPNDHTHSLVELLYHMITWAEFTRANLEKEVPDGKALEELDWRTIDPSIHEWSKGKAMLKSIHDRIIELLDTLDDSILDEIVRDRAYTYRSMINGLIQHDIYHLGQIIILKNLR